MINRSRFYVAAFALTVAGGLLAACAHDTVAPAGGPLTGLRETSGQDSSVSNGQNSGPGFYHGTVLGESPIGSGNDSLASAPRLANVRVTIYQEIQTANGPLTGTEMGSVVTGVDGLFTLPTLASGAYVVTFVPPSTSPYHGVYAFGYLTANSSNYPWWVVLGKK